jgi:hypothetical protein
MEKYFSPLTDSPGIDLSSPDQSSNRLLKKSKHDDAKKDKSDNYEADQDDAEKDAAANEDEDYDPEDDPDEDDELPPDDHKSNESESNHFDKVLNKTPPKLSIFERSRSISKPSTVRGDERKRKMSSISDSSHSTRGISITFEGRMNELSLLKLQDLKTKFPFVKGHPQLDSKKLMRCVPCGCDVKYNVLSTIKGHLESDRHKNNVVDHQNKVIPLQIQMKTFVREKAERREREEGVGHKKSLTTHEERMKLCYALVIDGIPFNFMESKNPNGLANILRSQAGIDVSSRAIRDLIPDIYEMETKNITRDIAKQDCFSIIFDATPDRGEAFGVVLRYITDMFEIQHRCITLKFYDSSFDHSSLGIYTIFCFCLFIMIYTLTFSSISCISTCLK